MRRSRRSTASTRRSTTWSATRSRSPSVKVFVQFNQHDDPARRREPGHPAAASDRVRAELLPRRGLRSSQLRRARGDHLLPARSTTPTSGPNVVLDIRDAVQIAIAAADGAPIPPPTRRCARSPTGRCTCPAQRPRRRCPDARPARSLDRPSVRLLRLPLSALAARHGRPGDVLQLLRRAAGTPQIVQTHSPVSLVFSAVDGTSSGWTRRATSPATAPASSGSRGTRRRTSCAPGDYSTMTVTGTGSGTAHIEVLGSSAPRSRATRGASPTTCSARTPAPPAPCRSTSSALLVR